MSVTQDGRPSRLRPVLAAALTALILVPVGFLALRGWTGDRDDRDAARREQHGVEYLTRLGPLVNALAEAQSAAVRRAAAPSSLAPAVTAVTAVDQRYGVELGTRGRWTQLRQRIDELPAATGDPATILQTYVQATDLALALAETARAGAGLSRDPSSDVWHLQDVLGRGLPVTVVQAGRMADLSAVLAAPPGDARQQNQIRTLLTPRLGAAALAVSTTVNELTDHLQLAVDDTDSPTLSGNLLGVLNTFQRSVEAITRDGAVPADAATLAAGQSGVRSAVSGLAGTIVSELNGLLRTRLDDRDRRLVGTGVAAGAAVLLVLAALIVAAGPRRRRPAGDRDTAGPGTAAAGTAAPDPAEPVTPGTALAPREHTGAAR